MPLFSNFALYRELLAIPAVKSLILSSFPARVAYGALPLTIFFKTVHDTNSIPLAGLAIGMNSLAGSLTAGARGSVMDKYGNKWPLRIFVPGYVTLLLTLNVVHSAFSILTVAFILGISAPPINLSIRPLWKTLVQPELTRTAYALDTSVINAATVVGPILATSLALSTRPGSALIVLALAIGFGGAALAIIPVSRNWIPEKKIEGEGAIWQHPAIRMLMLEGIFIGFGWGAFNVAVPAFATLEHVPQHTAWIFATMGICNILGGLIAGLIANHISPLRQFRRIYLLWFLLSLPLAFTHPDWTLALAGAFLGLCGGAQQVFYWEVMEAVRPKGSATSSMAWIWTVEGSFAAAGSAIGGWLSKTTSPRLCLAITTISVGCGLIVLTLGRSRLVQADELPSAENDLAAMRDNISPKG